MTSKISGGSLSGEDVKMRSVRWGVVSEER